MTAYEAYARRQEAEAFLGVNHISRLLFQSASQWAVERGLTVSSIKSAGPLPAERRAEIVKTRGVADQAFREAAERLRAVPAMKAADSRIAEAESALHAVENFRNKVDEDLSKPRSEEQTEVANGIIPTMTNLIDVAASKPRIMLETLTTPPTAALSQLVDLRRAAAQMAENAGRERALLSEAVTARRKLSAEEIGSLAGFRSQVEAAWELISPVAHRADTPAKIVNAIANVQKEYFGTYNETRNAVIAASESGEYKIGGGEYFARVTTAITSILRLADAVGELADQEAASEASKSMSNLIFSGMVLFTGVGLALLSFWIAFSRILKPLLALTSAMGELANGNFGVVLPGLGRKDEIGDMAHAVELFKVKAEEKARAEAKASMERDRVAAEQRRADMVRMADNFESAVGQIVDTVSSASAQLESSAGTLTATADRSRQLATAVASASEDASANVQSVASASEEMASSINEIGRQVQESARMAGEAVGQARSTTERVGDLSHAATRIGDVLELINTIAGQTNLLALNATIEAARAGAAGRGFAVVASEVKALAEQTAKATGEISQQVSGIQVATQESVSAIKKISGTIEKLSEISSTIAAAVEEQGAATQEIARNVQQAALGTQQVTSNITDVQRGATETGSASSQVLSAAQALSADSTRLRTEVSRFLGSVRAA